MVRKGAQYESAVSVLCFGAPDCKLVATKEEKRALDSRDYLISVVQTGWESITPFWPARMLLEYTPPQMKLDSSLLEYRKLPKKHW